MKTFLVSLTFLLLCFSRYCLARKPGELSQEQSWIGLTKQVYIIGVWESYLKTVNSCSNFRQDTTPALFTVWPEDDGEFCCEDRLTPHTIASYVHSEKNGRYLHPIPYYDVGIINAFTPYWRSWHPDVISQKDITNLVYCEVNDLKRFYVRRFWREAFAKQGLLYSAIPFILLVELLVLLSALLQWILSNQSAHSRVGPAPKTPNDPRPSPSPSRGPLPTFPSFLGWETTWDLVHLCFLGVNGSLLMEAVGHSDPCGWEAVLLYNSAVVYTYLSLLSIVSAVLQQIALWSRSITNDRLLRVDPTMKVKRFKIEKEWQLQRMSAQGAVLFVASLYCTFVTVSSIDEFVAWLLGIIIIAQVWSWSVGVAMLSKAVKLGRKCWKQRRSAEKKEQEQERERELELAQQTSAASDPNSVPVPDPRSGTNILRARPPSLDRSRRSHGAWNTLTRIWHEEH